MAKAKESTAVATKDEQPGTALTVQADRNRWLALAEDSDILEAMQANIASGETLSEQDLVRVPMPAAGGTTWAFESLVGEEETKEIVGVLVAVRPHGVLWGTEDPSDEQPVLVTYDLVRAIRVNEDCGDLDEAELQRCYDPETRTYDWAGLSYTQFGSGKGKACRAREQRQLFVLREQDAFPLLITAQPGSLKRIRPFIKTLPVAHYRAVVGLSLEADKNEDGVKFSKIVPRLVSTLDREVGALVKGMYTDAIQKMRVRTASV